MNAVTVTEQNIYILGVGYTVASDKMQLCRFKYTVNCVYTVHLFFTTAGGFNGGVRYCSPTVEAEHM